MISPSRLAALAALFTSTTLANGIVQVANFCSFDVYYALADSSGTNTNIGTVTGGGAIYQENQDLTPGRSIKLATSESALPDGNPVLQLEYTVTNGQIYYDISTVNGNPFVGHTVELEPSDSSCATLFAPGSQSSTGSGDVASCEDGTNLQLFLCFPS